MKEYTPQTKAIRSACYRPSTTKSNGHILITSNINNCFKPLAPNLVARTVMEIMHFSASHILYLLSQDYKQQYGGFGLSLWTEGETNYAITLSNGFPQIAPETPLVWIEASQVQEDFEISIRIHPHIVTKFFRYMPIRKATENHGNISFERYVLEKIDRHYHNIASDSWEGDRIKASGQRKIWIYSRYIPQHPPKKPLDEILERALFRPPLFDPQTHWRTLPPLGRKAKIRPRQQEKN